MSERVRWTRMANGGVGTCIFASNREISVDDDDLIYDSCFFDRMNSHVWRTVLQQDLFLRDSEINSSPPTSKNVHISFCLALQQSYHNVY